MSFSKVLFYPAVLAVILIFLLISCGQMNEPWDAAERLDVSHNILIFDDPTEVKKLNIINTSNYPINWSLESPSDDLVVSPFGGLLAANGVAEVEVRWLAMPQTGELRSEVLVLKSGNTVARQIEVKVLIPQSGRWMIDKEIIDAAFDKQRNRIWALSSTKELLEIDPLKKEIRSIPLEKQGLKLSINTAGDRLVVGHESSFSYVELPSGQLLQHKSLPFKIYDLVLSPNQWVYITDSQQQHSYIYAVNLQGPEADYSYTARIYSDASIAIHPSGEYLLLASTVISPDDVYKFKIENGSPQLMYDSPYHGDFRFGGKVWFDRAGDRFFTRSGNIHQFTHEQVWDLTYVTKFQGDDPFSLIISGTRKPSIYTVRDTNLGRLSKENSQPTLAVFNASDYRLIASTTLPKQKKLINGELVEYFTEIPFGFVSEQEDKFFLIEKGRNQEGSKFFWTVLTVSMD